MPAPICFPTADELPAELRVDASAYENRWLCDGQVRTWAGESMAIEAAVCVRDGDRVTRPVLGRVPALGEAEAMAALAAAKRAYDLGRGAWPRATMAERLKAVETFLAKLKPLRAEVVKLLMWEIGKPKGDAEKEFDRTVEYVRDTVHAVKDLDRQSSRFVIEQGVFGQIRRSPLGVVLCMGPYNYPLNETWTTLIPALIMGNTIVAKLPRFGQLLHLPIYSAFAESFPPGVVNFVSGDGRYISGPLMASGDVDVLAFIGSQRVGDLLKKSHPAPHRLRCVLGLGAKNAGIVLADADLDVAVREAVTGALSFSGQRCTALKLLLVERAVAEEFTRRFADAVSALKAGLPWEPGVKLTALPEDGKCDYLARPCRRRHWEGRPRRERERRRVDRHLLPSGRTLSVRYVHARVPGGAVRPGGPHRPVRRRARSHRRGGVEPVRAAGGDLRARREARRAPRGCARTAGVAHQSEQPVPARTRYLPVHRPQGERRGHAVGDGRAAGLQHPHHGRGARRRREPGARGVHRPRPHEQLRLHGFPVLMVAQDDETNRTGPVTVNMVKKSIEPRGDVIGERPASRSGCALVNP